MYLVFNQRLFIPSSVSVMSLLVLKRKLPVSWGDSKDKINFVSQHFTLT
jgi:hypothetical protein